MSTYRQYLQGKGLSKATVEHYHFYLLDYLTWLDKEGLQPEAVTTRDLMSYLAYLKQKGQTNASRKNRLIAASHYFQWQQQLGHREDNPAKPIKLRGTKTRRLYPMLSREELERIYHQYDANKPPQGKPNSFKAQQLSRQRNKAMLGLIVYQGLFTSEVSALTVNDLKLREGQVFIAGSRTSEERTLDLKPQQIIELMEYLLTTRKELLAYGTDPERKTLFLPAPASGRQQTTDNDAIHVWKRLTEDVKAQHPKLVNMLHIRTCVITHWLKQYNLRKVQYMAGHRYASTTETYLVNQMEDLQQDIDQFHPMG